MLELYRERLWRAWRTVRPGPMTDLPVNKAQLQGRVRDFDPEWTGRWLASLGARATWRAVRDARTGHTIHCVSDRPWADLTADLALGLRLMAWMSADRAMTWYWWDQPWPRVVPAHEDPDREHLNGGWAVPGILEVHVYRREEAHKVMLHESVHALGIDVPAGRIPPVLRRFEADLGRRLWPHLGECVTELFAEWLWSVAQATSLRQARALWNAQLLCSRRQAAAVWARIHDATEPEGTNVFAYYVLKWVLMGHQDEVLVNPDRTVGFWFDWWRAARPVLDEMAKEVMYTEGVPMSMGMTCPSENV